MAVKTIEQRTFVSAIDSNVSLDLEIYDDGSGYLYIQDKHAGPYNEGTGESIELNTEQMLQLRTALTLPGIGVEK